MISRDARVLVIVVSRIGDTLLATPAIRALSAACANGELTVLAHPSRIELLRHLPFIQHLAPITKRRAAYFGWLARRHSYDCAVVYGHDAALLRYALRVARQVAAFRQADIHLNARLFAAVAPPATPMHAIHERLMLPIALGATTNDFRLSYQVTEAERATALTKLESLFPDQDGPLVGLQLMSFQKKSYRDWPLDHFSRFAAQVRAAHANARLLVFGGKESEHAAADFCQQHGPRAASVAGKLQLRASAALMSQLNLYVGVDTGPTHLAGALGIPMVALYHCRHRGALLAPLQHPHLEVIEHPTPDDACSHISRMAEISVETVWRAAQRVLAHSLPQATA